MQFKFGESRYVPGQGRAQIQQKNKCQRLLAFVKPSCQSVFSIATKAKQKLDDKLEEERMDQNVEYPFDEGWKCSIF